MKMFSQIAIVSLTALSCFTLFSFTNGDGKKKYQIIHHENGEAIIYDTVISMNSTYSVENFLADKGIESDNVEVMMVPQDGEKVVIMKEIREERTNDSEAVIEEELVEISVEVDEAGNRTIHKTVNGEKVKMTEEELAELEKEMSAEEMVIEMEDDSHQQTRKIVENDELKIEKREETIEISVKVDENGEKTVQKFVNGKEVEMTEEELEMMEIKEENGMLIIEMEEEVEDRTHQSSEPEIIIDSTEPVTIVLVMENYEEK